MPYRIKQRCRNCSHEWHWVSRAQSVERLNARPYNPRCPMCAKRSPALGMDVAAGKAPGVGGSNLGRAMDQVADQVMTDYSLTNLSSARAGEAMAPKLDPQRQALADGMFNGGNRKNMVLPPALRGTPQQVLQRAVAGQFRSPDAPDPVALAQSQVPAPNFLIRHPGKRRPERG